MINKTRWFENVSFLFNPQYLREIFIKARNQEQFWNPQHKQISKLSLVVRFDVE